VRGTDAASLEYEMMRIAAAFGGPEWAHALAVMAQVRARSSDAVTVAEFRAMVRALAA
jgi:anti-sigma factor ChrR (cupin superfamily)